ncbi:DUF4956 domain-containing protein [Paenibacillus mucilaginosus]|uniref:Cell dividion protein FtsZ n=2 Tax=Paenibacillus mucilaginosus TaxID=61624 RepID=I0BBR5_9BACL|nr:DUF4956 domain-containing protein [Paenibacillus mucilaginosus]AEI39381.1 hypothetical protein KNP414_00791 [Paenibacillus mucilaginosus KNP414]AFH59812.1 cell dividion protein FtsZ [Paenibacillus mucilaginosus K02]MCG7214776.1 DUF4956 domain-containing protein [Paenibacillus mucilaginosus]WDM28367.1 DUF4956 domain-containing protein [Paenibacillus mucilaginosus]
MLDTLFAAATTDNTLTFTHAILTIVVSFLLGGVISLTYMKTSKQAHSQNFALTMILIPSIIAIIILLIGNNVARAFSLAGAFSIIRFRSAPGDPKDISYVLFTMATGLACGVGMFGYAVLFTLILCVLMIVLHKIKFGEKRSDQKLLKITVPEDLGYEEAFEEVFRQFNVVHDLKKVKTTELGSLFELVYAITLRPGTSQKELIDALRCRNGNLNITLSMSPETTDY